MDTQRRKASKRKTQKEIGDNIEKVGSSQWMRVAQDRSAWSELWRPFASNGINAGDDDGT